MTQIYDQLDKIYCHHLQDITVRWFMEGNREIWQLQSRNVHITHTWFQLPP